ncbi:hypothetical protein IFR05_006597 [Cadophora sp. M221]|nr:hypothetical protein IFR05_006597 [Cadophora sp. M221]
MSLIDRLGLRCQKSGNSTSDDSSDGECDLDVFNPFEQFDMGITADGKPTSSFSSMSAYNVVDSPRLTMDDFLKRAPDATGDGRPEAHRAVSFDSAVLNPHHLDNHISLRSDTELRRVAAANSLDRLYQTQEAAAKDESRGKDPQRRPKRVPRPRSFSNLPGEPYLRSRSSLRQEAPRDSVSIPSPSYEPETITKTHAPPFQRVAGLKFEPGDGPATKSKFPKPDTISIPHRSSRGIRQHIPARITDKLTPMKTTDVHEPFKKHMELELKRRTSKRIPVCITKGDPKRKTEEMTNTAIKRWAFWGALNRAGQDSKGNPKVDVGTRTSGNESEHSIDVDRTEAFKCIESADQATRARILDGHVEQVMEAARVHFKDAGARKCVNVVDNEPGKRHSRFVNIESAREEVIMPARIPPSTPKVNMGNVSSNERKKPARIFQGLRRWFRKE